MSGCEVMQAALLDEALPRPAELETHLAGCAECQALAAAHRSALRLSGVTPRLAARRSVAEAKRRAGIVGGLCLALFGAVGWWQLEFGRGAVVAGSREPVAELPVQQIIEAPPRDTGAAEFAALVVLQRDVEASLHRDAREDETLLRAFGALAQWTQPSRTRPMRSLGRAASPVVYTLEDSP